MKELQGKTSVRYNRVKKHNVIMAIMIVMLLSGFACALESGNRNSRHDVQNNIRNVNANAPTLASTDADAWSDGYLNIYFKEQVDLVVDNGNATGYGKPRILDTIASVRLSRDVVNTSSYLVLGKSNNSYNGTEQKTIDLNGHTLSIGGFKFNDEYNTSTDYDSIKSKGLRIEDSSEGKSGKLILNGGIIFGGSDYSNSSYKPYSGNVIINGGTIYSTSGAALRGHEGVKNSTAKPHIVINGGTVYGITNKLHSATITVNGGTVYSPITATASEPKPAISLQDGGAALFKSGVIDASISTTSDTTIKTVKLDPNKLDGSQVTVEEDSAIKTITSTIVNMDTPTATLDFASEANKAAGHSSALYLLGSSSVRWVDLKANNGNLTGSDKGAERLIAFSYGTKNSGEEYSEYKGAAVNVSVTNPIEDNALFMCPSTFGVVSPVKIKTEGWSIFGTQGGNSITYLTKKHRVVTYKTGEATHYTQSVPYNKRAAAPTDPTYGGSEIGMTFVGWYINDSKYDFNTIIMENITLTAKFAVAKASVQIGEVTTYYPYMTNALTAYKNATADAMAVLTLFADVTSDDVEYITGFALKNTIDLNGYSMAVNDKVNIDADATSITIKDSKGGGKFTTSGALTIASGQTLNLINATIYFSRDTNISNSNLKVKKGGTLIAEDSNISRSFIYPINNLGTATLTNCTVSATDMANASGTENCVIQNSGALIIDGGTLSITAGMSSDASAKIITIKNISGTTSIRGNVEFVRNGINKYSDIQLSGAGQLILASSGDNAYTNTSYPIDITYDITKTPLAEGFVLVKECQDARLINFALIRDWSLVGSGNDIILKKNNVTYVYHITGSPTDKYDVHGEYASYDFSGKAVLGNKYQLVAKEASAASFMNAIANDAGDNNYRIIFGDGVSPLVCNETLVISPDNNSVEITLQGKLEGIGSAYYGGLVSVTSGVVVRGDNKLEVTCTGTVAAFRVGGGKLHLSRGTYSSSGAYDISIGSGALYLSNAPTIGTGEKARIYNFNNRTLVEPKQQTSEIHLSDGGVSYTGKNILLNYEKYSDGDIVAHNVSNLQQGIIAVTWNGSHLNGSDSYSYQSSDSTIVISHTHELEYTVNELSFSAMKPGYSNKYISQQCKVKHSSAVDLWITTVKDEASGKVTPEKAYKSSGTWTEDPSIATAWTYSGRNVYFSVMKDGNVLAKIELDVATTGSAVNAVCVVESGGTTTYYSDFRKAFAAANASNGRIALINTVTVAGTDELAVTGNVTIYAIKTPSGYIIPLKLNDAQIVIKSGGTLTIENAEIESKTYGVVLQNGATMHLSGSAALTTSGNAAVLFDNADGDSMKLVLHKNGDKDAYYTSKAALKIDVKTPKNGLILYEGLHSNVTNNLITYVGSVGKLSKSDNGTGAIRTSYSNYVITLSGDNTQKYSVCDVNPNDSSDRFEEYRAATLADIMTKIKADMKKNSVTECNINLGGGTVLDIGIETLTLSNTTHTVYTVTGKVTGSGEKVIEISLSNTVVNLNADITSTYAGTNSYAAAVYIASSVTRSVTVTGGTISAITAPAFYHEGNSMLICNQSSRPLSITSGTSKTSTGSGTGCSMGTISLRPYNNNVSKFVMNGGTVTNSSATGVTVYSSTTTPDAITISNATIVGAVDGVVAWSGGVILTNCNITISVSESRGYGVFGKTALSIIDCTITQPNVAGYAIWSEAEKAQSFKISGNCVITGTVFSRIAIVGSGYTGSSSISINFSPGGGIKDDMIVVFGSTDSSKWSIISDKFVLLSSGGNLVAKSNITITFDKGGVLDNTIESILPGSALTVPLAPSATGFVFGGWYTDSTFGTAFDFTQPLSADTTLYAKWTILAPEVEELSDVSKVYDGESTNLSVNLGSTNNKITYSYSWSLQGSDEFSSTDSYISYMNTGKNVYICTVTATFNGQSIATTISVTIEVTKAVLTVTAQDQTIVYGNDIDQSEYLISGFKGADVTTRPQIIGNPTLTANALSVKDGNVINIDIATMSTDNYTFRGVSGNLTVTKANYTSGEVAIPDLAGGVYDANKTLDTDYFLPEGYRWADDTENTVPTVDKNATGYAAIYNADSDNYFDYAITVTIAITKQKIDLPNITAKVYNGQIQVADMLESGLYTVIANTGGKDVGDYTVTLSVTNFANQEWTTATTQEVDIIFLITKRAVTVTIADQRTPRGSDLINFVTVQNLWTITSGSVVNNDNLNITIAAANANNTVIAKTEITGIYANNNYLVTFEKGTYSVYSVEGYNNFMGEYGDTIEFDPEQISIENLDDIMTMAEAYRNLDEDSSAQLSQTDLDKITALNDKAREIAEAKATAETALKELKGTTVNTIRTDGIDNLKQKHAVAETAINKYKGLSAGLKGEDLSGYTEYYLPIPILLKNYNDNFYWATLALEDIENFKAEDLVPIPHDNDRRNIQSLLDTAIKRVKDFGLAGGTDEKLVKYSQIDRVTTELAAFDAYLTFYDKHKHKWELNTDNLTLGFVNLIDELEAAYNELQQNARAVELLTEKEIELVNSVILKATDIKAAKTAAETVLKTLDGTKVDTIRQEKGIDELTKKHTAAIAAVKVYTDYAQGNLKLSDLNCYWVIDMVTPLLDNYSKTLIAANAALDKLVGKTAAGIVAGTYELQAVKTLLKTANSEYKAFSDAGGTEGNTDLVGFGEIARVTEAIAIYNKYNTFMTRNRTTISLVPNNITYANISRISMMFEEYEKSLDAVKELLTEIQINNITALNDKAKEILAAKATAEKALKALENFAADDIATDGIAIWNTNISTAQTAIADYTNLSTGLKAQTELVGFADLAKAVAIVKTYDDTLIAANTALDKLVGKTAAGIVDGDYTRDEVESLLVAATTATTAFFTAGGTNENSDLVGFGEITRVTEAIATYDKYKIFHDEHKLTWEKDLTALTLVADGELIAALDTAYQALGDESKLLRTAEKTAIETIIETHAEIANLNTLADNALALLSDVTAIKLRDKLLDKDVVASNISAAKTAIKNFTDKSSGVSTAELANYSNLAHAEKAVADFEAYEMFIGIAKDVIALIPDELLWSKVAVVNDMLGDYDLLTDHQKELLSDAENANVIALKNKADTLTEKKTIADESLAVLDSAIKNGADKETLQGLLEDSNNKVNEFISENGTHADIPSFDAIEKAEGKILEYEKKEVSDKIEDEIGAVEEWTDEKVGGLDIAELENAINKVQDIIGKIDECGDKTKEELSDQRGKLAELKETLAKKLHLEKAKAVAIEGLKAELESILSSSTYSSSAKREIAETYASAIEKISLATTTNIISEHQEVCVAEMRAVEELHVGWLVADIALAVLLLAEIAYLAFRKFGRGKKKSVETYSVAPIGLLAASGVGLTMGIFFFVILLLAVLALGILIVNRILHDHGKKSLFAPISGEGDKLLGKDLKDLTEQPKVEQQNVCEIQQITNQIPVMISEEQPQLLLQSEQPEKDDIESIVEVKNGLKILVRYNFSFRAKLIQAPKEIQDRYSELKNEFLSYSGIKCSISWRKERFYIGKKTVAAFVFRGRTLYSAFALDPKDFAGTKHHGIDMTEVKCYQHTPLLLKVINDRKVKYAKEIFSFAVAALCLNKGEHVATSYKYPFETTETLIECGLVKELILKEIYDNFLAQQSRELVSHNRREFISAHEASVLISDEVAATLIERERSTIAQGKTSNREVKKGKLGVINIDTLSSNFQHGDVITLESLKKKRLISKHAARLKVLARGILDKSLSVYADEFSLDSVKMIALTGGKTTKQK